MSFEKLKILANNPKELLEAVKIVERREAIKNGHDMSEFYTEDWGSISGIFHTHVCACKKCDYEVYIESDRVTYKYYIDNDSVNKKCPAI